MNIITHSLVIVNRKQSYTPHTNLPDGGRKMKSRTRKSIISIVLALVMVLALLPTGIIPVYAASVEVSGAVSASSLSDGVSLVLTGDTELTVDRDITLSSISGEYKLTVTGSRKLTVNSSGTAIGVKGLFVYADLHVQTQGRAIDSKENVYIKNNYLFVNGGIFSVGGMEINCNDATIAGSKYALYNQITGISLIGNFLIGAGKYAIYSDLGYLQMSGSVECNTVDESEFSVYAETDISTFNTVDLKVRGNGGIYSSLTNIRLKGNVDIITEKSFAVYAEKGFVTLNGESIVATSRATGSDATSLSFGIAAAKEVTVVATERAVIGGSRYGVYSAKGDITLGGGEFNVSADEYAVYSASGNISTYGEITIASEQKRAMGAPKGNITAIGSLSAESNSENYNELNYAVISCGNEFNFSGDTLLVKGACGIFADMISVNAKSTTVIASIATAVLASSENTESETSGDIDIISDYLWIQSYVQNMDYGLGIDADGDVYLQSNDGTVVGSFGIYSGANMTLIGNFDVASGFDNAISANGFLAAWGTLEVNCLAENSNAINVNGDFIFLGEELKVSGAIGLGVGGNVTVSATKAEIITAVGNAIYSDETVEINCDDLWVQNRAPEDNETWYEYGIFGKNGVKITSEDASVSAYDSAILSSEGSIDLNGNFHLTSTCGNVVEATDGSVDMEGTFLLSAFENNGIKAFADASVNGSLTIDSKKSGIWTDTFFFDGSLLKITGSGGIDAENDIVIKGTAIDITATSEELSGIWSNKGSVDITGNLKMKTNGWHGIYGYNEVKLGSGSYFVTGPKGGAHTVLSNEKITFSDSDLKVVAPKNGYVEGNSIHESNGNVAKEVLIYSPIEDVFVNVNLPREGEQPARSESELYGLHPLCSVNTIIWYEDGEKMGGTAPFAAGKEYSLEIYLDAAEGYSFVAGVAGKVNGKNVSTAIMDAGNQHMRLTVSLGKCPTKVRGVSLEVAEPVEGKIPSQSVTAGNSNYGVRKQNITWQVSEDGINYTDMAEGERFVGGKYYRVYMDVTTADTNKLFAMDYSGTSAKHNVLAHVNGEEVKVEKIYDTDPERHLGICYEFGPCPDTVVEHIEVEGIRRPIAGQNPSYTAYVKAEGYRIDTDKNAYTEIYWHNPIEYKYYIVRGIRWYDVTDPENVKDVYENDVFIEGHKYEVVVYLVTNDGYEFAYDPYTEPETWPTASVNGNEAEVTQFGSDLKWSQKINYTFPEAETAPDYMKGDFDFDGKITVADALAALRIAARMAEETADSILIGDIDGDDAVTVADALAILRVAAKMADTL